MQKAMNQFKPFFSFLIPFSIASLFMVFTQCSSQNGEDVFDRDPPPDTIGTGFTTDFRFRDDIKPILDQNCAFAGCHVSGTGRQPFTDYNEVVNAINNFNFRERIQDGSMPPSGPLPQDTIDKVVDWIDGGYPED